MNPFDPVRSAARALTTNPGQLRSGALVSCATALVAAASVSPVSAHGSIVVPLSRVMQCRFADNPENPVGAACAAAQPHAQPSTLQGCGL